MTRENLLSMINKNVFIWSFLLMNQITGFFFVKLMLIMFTIKNISILNIWSFVIASSHICLIILLDKKANNRLIHPITHSKIILIPLSRLLLLLFYILTIEMIVLRRHLLNVVLLCDKAKQQLIRYLKDKLIDYWGLFI